MGIGAAIGTGMRYAGRATLLRCPVCGTKPIFKPLVQVRSFDDWFTPLDGCPRCGYAYDREPGYFLMAVWGVNYGVIALIGLSAYVLAERFAKWSFLEMTLAVVLPMPILQVLFARHAKAYFLALDHFFDPHTREDDDNDDEGKPPSPEDLPPAPPAMPVSFNSQAS